MGHALPLLIPLLLASVLASGLASADPRVAEADAALAEAETYPRAIELYDAYLLEHPEASDVRLRLARVLAWSGELERAVVELDRLLEAGPDVPLEVERAEVLSWAGRYPEAEAALADVLAREPEHVRASLALARVYRWSGRADAADRAYGRVLELGESSEAAAERRELRELYPPEVALSWSHASDDEDFTHEETGARASAYVDLATRVEARLAYAHVRDVFPGAGGGNDREESRAVHYALRVERHLGPVFLLSAELGHEAWRSAPDEISAGIGLRVTPAESTSLHFDYLHDGVGRDVQSLAAIESGIHRDELEASLWRDLPGGFDFWGRVGGGWFSDGNSRARGELSLGFRPFEAHAATLQLGVSALHYENETGRYFAPSWSTDQRVEAVYATPEWWGLQATLRAGVGYGISRENGTNSDGVVYSGSSSLRWEWRRFQLELSAGFSQSRRENVYRSRRFGVALGRAF